MSKIRKFLLDGMVKIIIVLVCSILGAILYRLGGTSAGTKWRDIGVSVVLLATCLILGLKTSFLATLGAYLLTFGLSWAALTTYWKKKGTDAKWYNWVLTGLGYSLAVLPIAILTHHYIGFGIRTIALILTTTLWSEFIGQDWLEEGGRGFLFISSLPILLV